MVALRETGSQRIEVVASAAFGLLFLVMGAIDVYDGEYSTGVGFVLLGVVLLGRGTIARTGVSISATGAVQAATTVLLALAFVSLLWSVVQRITLG